MTATLTFARTEPVADGHHLMCSKRPVDEVPAHVEGQEALL